MKPTKTIPRAIRELVIRELARKAALASAAALAPAERRERARRAGVASAGARAEAKKARGAA